MKLKAHAKLNLTLRVFPKRADGFHDIESIMRSVSLHDVVTLTPIDSGIEVTCDQADVPQGKDNLAYKAAEMFLNQAQGLRPQALGLRPCVSGCKIHIEKHIPMAAGLAGGSADAAAVLYGLNQLSDSPMPDVQLAELGAHVGSDVPFCLTGGTCLVRGRGEVVEKQKPWPKAYFVLVCPDVHVSTKWAYEEFDRLPKSAAGQTKNDLEPAVIPRHPVIAEIKTKLRKLGCSESQMSGSGPSVFGVVTGKAEAETVLKKINEEYAKSFLLETVGKGIEPLRPACRQAGTKSTKEH